MGHLVNSGFEWIDEGRGKPRPLSIKIPVWFFDAMEEAFRALKILTDFRAAH